MRVALTIRPNEGGDDDENPEELAENAWVCLLDLDEKGVYSLKPFEEVLEMKANKINIGLTCREIMRQAWSECQLLMSIFSI